MLGIGVADGGEKKRPRKKVLRIVSLERESFNIWFVDSVFRGHGCTSNGGKGREMVP